MYLLLITYLIQREGKEKIPWNTPLPEALLPGGAALGVPMSGSSPTKKVGEKPP